MDKFKNFLFREKSISQTLAKNSFWSAVSNFGSQFIKLLIIIYAARILGAEQYGLFAYALSIAATFTIFSDLGLNQVFFINLARKDENPKGYLSTLIFLRIGLVTSVIILTILVGPLMAKFPEAKILIPLVTLLVAFDDFRAFLNGFARAENRIDKEALGNIATNIFIAIFAFFGLKYLGTPFALAATYLAGSFIGTLVVFLVIKKGFQKIFLPIKFKISIVKNILSLAIPFSLASSMWMIMTNTDALVIGWLRSVVELGYYAAAQRPVMAFSLIPTILVASSGALIAMAAKEEAKERLRILVERLTTFSLAIALPLILGGIILAPSIIEFLYGSGYAPATLSFRLLLITLLISYPGSVITNLILAFKQQKIFAIAMVSGALGNIILDLLLIPPFGIAGSVIATIIALGIINGYIWYHAKKFQDFKILHFLGKIFIASFLMGAVTFGLKIISVNLFLNIFISAAFYLGLLIILKERLFQDVKNIFR